MEYWFDVRLRSACMPEIFAFPMLRNVHVSTAGESEISDLGLLQAPGHLLGSVQVRQEVHNPDRREKSQIDLPHQGLLLLWRERGALMNTRIFNLFGRDVLDLALDVYRHNGVVQGGWRKGVKNKVQISWTP